MPEAPYTPPVFPDLLPVPDTAVQYYALLRTCNGFTEGEWPVQAITCRDPLVEWADDKFGGKYHHPISEPEYNEFVFTGTIRALRHRMWDRDKGILMTRKETDRRLDTVGDPHEPNCQCQSCCCPNGTDCGHG
jgi:hypothetical protein